jgi:hypothetical protein
VASGLVFYPFRRLDYLFSGFVQDEITLVNNRLALTAGSKILRTNFAGFDVHPEHATGAHPVARTGQELETQSRGTAHYHAPGAQADQATDL